MIWLAFRVWSLHDYINKKTFFDDITANAKRKILGPFFGSNSNNIPFFGLPLHFKWKITFFSVYIIRACLLIRFYGRSPVNGSILMLRYPLGLTQKLLFVHINQTSVVRLKRLWFVIFIKEKKENIDRILTAMQNTLKNHW